MNARFIIRFCDDLEEYVVSIDSINYPKNKLPDFPISFADPDLFNLKFHEAVNVLENKYAELIANEKYSKNKYTKQWSNFSSDDIMLIEESLNINK